MGRKILIACRDFEVEAELLEERCPKTCDAIWNALPLEAELEVWKEEVYFDIPVRIAPENPTSKTSAGDVAYWPEGQGFCIFFGRSQPISKVNVFARVREGVELFKLVKTGDSIKVKRSGALGS